MAISASSVWDIPMTEALRAHPAVANASRIAELIVASDSTKRDSAGRTPKAYSSGIRAWGSRLTSTDLATD